ncbi:riboflavin synthase [Pseudomonas sp. BN417]|uniref:riboflavin synthase n=1 Tax=unclassified Pseudomonas TaxID=196821 RepID=UPI0008578A0D|nr:riboflavin synthase subunit alpha [Pseudomonas sp. TCU-HL1]MDH4554057.1 riboflavin synthase [Pseudomonas sp. BN417]
MFTGIIEAVGLIGSIEPCNGDLRIFVQTGTLDLIDLGLGDSVAVNGVCLTVVRLLQDGFWADVSQETLSRSSLAGLKQGARVNLEKALRANSRLGGHMVSGHVDGLGKVVLLSCDARSWLMRIQTPAALSRYIAEKGSITVDGVSLTVNAVADDCFDLNIVPHTMKMTNMSDYRVGQQVNLEIDLIARYVERLLVGDKQERLGKDARRR